MYATKEDIKTLFRDFADNPNAAVNDTDLDLFIQTSTAVINSKVGTLYQLPITEISNPTSFSVLKTLQMYMVACKVDNILNDHTEANNRPMWCKASHKLMVEIVPDKKDGKQPEPTLKLLDATYLGTSIQRNKIKISQTSGAKFKKGVDTW